MIRASSIGAAAAASATRSTTVDRGQAELAGGRGRPRRCPAAPAGSAVTTFGRTVTMPASAGEAARRVELAAEDAHLDDRAAVVPATRRSR